MDAFKVQFSREKSAAEQLIQQKKQLKEISGVVENVRGTLRGKIACEMQIRERLRKIESQLEEDAAAMDRLSDALTTIINRYMQTEAAVCGNQSNPVTNLQQELQDQYMKQEIENILSQEKFSEERWEQASLEERKQIIQELGQEMETVLGIDIPDPKYRNDWDESIAGGYQYEDNELYLNEKLLEKDILFASGVLQHEIRHAYQDAVCENPDNFLVTEERIEEWQNSINRYEEDLSNGRYAQQVLEEDAREFAGQDSENYTIGKTVDSNDENMMYDDIEEDMWNPSQRAKHQYDNILWELCRECGLKDIASCAEDMEKYGYREGVTRFSIKKIPIIGPVISGCERVVDKLKPEKTEMVTNPGNIGDYDGVEGFGNSANVGDCDGVEGFGNSANAEDCDGVEGFGNSGNA